MRIIITGSTGFVGRNLVPMLLKEGHQLLELTIEPNISQELYGNTTSKLLVTEDQNLLKNAVMEFNPETVIHLASYLTSFDDYKTLQKLLSSNIIFFCRVLDAIKDTDIKLFINTGTFAEYYNGDGFFDPAYLYSATKTASRSFLDYFSKVYNFKQTTVVPYTIYGGKDTQQKIIDILYNSISSPFTIDLSPGDQVLDFIHIDDVADFYVTIVEKMESLPEKLNFHLGTGIGHTLREVAGIMEELTRGKVKVNWGGRRYRPSDVMYAVADDSLSKKVLNWEPGIDLQTGISKYINKQSNNEV